jgi:glycine cleavage system H protein
VKTVHSLLSPLSGTILSSNTALRDDPLPIAESPYGEGWMVVIEADGDSLPKGLMDYAAYIEFTLRGEH